MTVPAHEARSSEYDSTAARPWVHGARRLGWLLLVLLCLVPRALMAWKIGGICPDAVLYIRVAESFDKGLLHEDQYNRFGLNFYPVVLMLLHRSGLDWELAGKLWGVAISCLTVLPLYGWVRRQFDDRVALIAGCLYALHPELVRWSPEGIRDPTFWFFMVLSLYWLWRAVSEVRLPFFLCGGLAMALAALTRSEGFFLLVPLLLWSFRRSRSLLPRGTESIAICNLQFAMSQRRKLALGVMLAVGVLPALLVLAALFWFHGHAPWELVRTKPLEFIERWIHACLASFSAHDQAVSASGMRWTTMAGLFASAMFKGLTPVFALFACVGAALWWRTGRRGRAPGTRNESTSRRVPGRRVMFYVVLLFLLTIWIHLNVAEETSSRYFLPVVLLLSPLGALGLLACSERLLRWAESRRWGLKAGRLASRAPLLLFAVLGLGSVIIADYRHRAVQAELGRWAGNEFGPSPALLGPGGVTQVVAYYSNGRYELFDPHDDDRVVEDLIRQGSFDMVLLPRNHQTVPGNSELLRYAAGLGYGPVDDGQFADKLRNMAVLVRRNTAVARQAERPHQKPGGEPFFRN